MDHLESMSFYANNINVARMLRDIFPHPYSIEDGKQFIQKQMERDPADNFAVMINGKAIGSIGLMLKGDIHCKNAEIGYWIGEPFWGKGIVSTLVPKVVTYGFEHFDINRIFGLVSHKNPASCRVLEKCGFQLEARLESTLFKQGEYHDALIYAVRKNK
ncbi:MAG: GNAT family N-acetyltransferase [Bacteroidetes bacterium]|nr:GNAT family N-acetyltransferase [Bacteroidota bacterium]